MIRHTRLQHKFVESFPDKLEPGILYVSLQYGSATHTCCCGCGEEVVTPLTPTDWKLIYDGETVSLHPSVGSWTLPCRSHYVIWRGQVVGAEPWTEQRIEAARRQNHEAKAKHYGTAGANASSPQASPAATNLGDDFVSFWRWLNGRR